MRVRHGISIVLLLKSRLSNHLHGHYNLFDRNHNIAWNNKSYLSIAKKRFALIASDVQLNLSAFCWLNWFNLLKRI